MVDETEDCIYKELSYEVIGSFYEVFNNLGFGHREKHYCNAVAKELQTRDIPFKREEYAILSYKGDAVGKFFFDFTIDNKIIIEVKVNDYFSKTNIEQLYRYLVTKNMVIDYYSGLNLIDFIDVGVL